MSPAVHGTEPVPRSLMEGREAPVEAREGVRKLEAGDHEKGFLDLLSTLSTVGDVSESRFKEQLSLLDRNGDYTVLVVEDRDRCKVLATGSLFVEHKFIHECGMVGHIEDVVVLPEARGQGLGRRIVRALVREAAEKECYKVILDCAEKNAEFYEKVGMVRKEIQMVKYF